MTNTQHIHGGYYTEDDLKSFGFRSVGRHVKIAKNVTIIGAHNISIGHHVRIDPYTIITSSTEAVTIGHHVHIGAGCFLAGGGGINIENYAGLSQHVKIYSTSDDYSGDFMTNPTIPNEFTNVHKETVTIAKHAIAGAGSIIMPGTHMDMGSVLGALSMASGTLESFKIYGGVPAKYLKDRNQDLLKMEDALQDHMRAS